MPILDGTAKTTFALTQALAARALADAVPDPHAKRIAARGVFIAVDSFITVARQTRNAIPKSKTNSAERLAIKQSLNHLADRDWGPIRGAARPHRRSPPTDQRQR